MTASIDHRQGQQVVFVKEFRKLGFFGALVARDEGFLCQSEKRGGRRRQNNLHQGHSTCQRSRRICEVDSAHILHATFETAHRLDCILSRGRYRESDELSSHAAGGGVLFELQEVRKFLALLGL